MNADTATIDFETRSACSIRNCGSWRYSLDPTTEVLCMAFRLPYWDAGRTALWHPAFPHLEILEADCHDELIELMEWIDAGYLVEAHSAFFERGIWTNILGLRYGWPSIRADQWRCSAAKAAAHALPRGLEDAISALRLAVHKDTEGHKLMLKLSKPRKPRKAEREAGITDTLWWESRELFERLWAYCRQDVLAEEALSHGLADLNPTETAVYSLDQTINERGFQLDGRAVATALKLIAKETLTLNQELEALTNGQVKKATQRAQILSWFAEQGLVLPDTQRETLEETALDPLLSPEVSRCLEIVRALGRSSTAKYRKMRDWTCPDGRVHGGLLYHGAGTGRWAGAGVQPQNFPKGNVKDMEALWADLKAGRPQENMMEALSGALRGAIVAAPGKTLFVADYSSIEARVLLWLAEDEESLDLFRSGRCIYMDFASDIFGYPVTHKEKQKMERGFGKVGILGLGFQCGVSKFVKVAWDLGRITIPEEPVEGSDEISSRQVVNAYRAKYWRVVDMWRDQNDAAISAVLTKRPVECGKVQWQKEGGFLFCVLPSGRKLAYPNPEIRVRQTPWGEPKPALTFMGMNTYTRKWERQVSYGGMIVENQTQAVARDLLASALLALEASKVYLPVLSAHDETICEGLPDAGIAGFNKIMTSSPRWADGIPIAIDSWTGPRYKKG